MCATGCSLDGFAPPGRLIRATGSIRFPDSCHAPPAPKYTGLSLSADGRFVAFTSRSSDLAPGDTNGTFDAFVHDRATRSTERVSFDATLADGTGSGFSASIDRSGRRIAFNANGPLTVGDLNGLTDVYMLDRGAPGPFATYCHGNEARYPCGNGSASYAGCASSFGSGGRLIASGVPSVAADTLVLVLEPSGLPAPGPESIPRHARDPRRYASRRRSDERACARQEVAQIGARRGFSRDEQALVQRRGVSLQRQSVKCFALGWWRTTADVDCSGVRAESSRDSMVSGVSRDGASIE